MGVHAERIFSDRDLTMLTNAPIDNANDTAFTRELKGAIRDIYAELRRIRMTGDGATFYVTENAGGSVGHATAEGGGAGGAMAEIQSHVNANEYLADVYLTGRYVSDGVGGWEEVVAEDETDVTLLITQIDADQTLPNGTWVTVVDCGDHYEGNVPRAL